MPKIMGTDVKRLREGLGLSRMELAVKLGVSYPTVIKWETGKNDPSPMAVRGILGLLDEGSQNP